jgi:hypothetical protein
MSARNGHRTNKRKANVSAAASSQRVEPPIADRTPGGDE